VTSQSERETAEVAEAMAGGFRGGDGDERELGLEELPGPRGVLAVEWAERLRDVPWRAPVRVRLDHGGEDVRRIVIEDAT
jgi:tRNA A37 threonylcarbamoyladenosine biosynthesis protein TsaE